MFSRKKAKKVKRRLNIYWNSRRVWRILSRNYGWTSVTRFRQSRSIIISPRQGHLRISLLYFSEIFLARKPWRPCNLSYHRTYWLATPKDKTLDRRQPKEVDSRWFWSPTVCTRDSLSRMTQNIFAIRIKVNLSNQW